MIQLRHRSRRALPVALGAAVAALSLAAPAHAADVRHAVASGGVSSGLCPADVPCTLAHAVGGAASNDEVIVHQGTYNVASGLIAPVPMHLHGAAGEPRPRLVGAPDLGVTTLTFEAGGTVADLAIETRGVANALDLANGVGERLVLVAAGGTAAKLATDGRTTVLRDTAARSASSSTPALKTKESGGAGHVALRNVTVLAAATGIDCKTSSGASTTLVNVLVRGTGYDVDALGGTCSADHSNFRPAASPGLTLGAGNQSGEPLLADASNGDFHPVAGSRTIDAGTTDVLLGTADPDGVARTAGRAPDIGAFEYTGASSVTAPPAATTPPASGGEAPAESTPTPPAGTRAVPPAAGRDHSEKEGERFDDLPAELRGVPAPVLGRTVVIAPGRGTVLVRVPGAERFRPLDETARVPVGTQIDATDGRIRLVSAITGGRVQTGTFWGGQFRIRQSRGGNGMTELSLQGGSFAACRAQRSTAVASARRRRAVRRLWARDRHGRFRTHGRRSVATARGTAWVTEDRCDGTYTRVTEGAVSVRNKVTKTTKLVRAGTSYLARSARR